MTRVFRERAIKAYLDPDQRGTVLHVTPPAIARMVITLGIVVAGALVASAFARVQVTASGRGLVRPVDGVAMVRAPIEGIVRSVDVVAGQKVAAGATLFSVDAPVLAPVAGIVDALSVRAGDVVHPGEAVAKIVPTDEKLVGYLVIPARFRANLRAGQAVRLSFDEFPWEEMGYGEGHIERVSEDLITPDLAAAYVLDRHSSAPGDSSDPTNGPGFLIVVALDKAPPLAKRPMHNGMSFDGVVPVRKQRLLALLIRPLAQLFGD